MGGNGSPSARQCASGVNYHAVPDGAKQNRKFSQNVPETRTCSSSVMYASTQNHKKFFVAIHSPILAAE